MVGNPRRRREDDLFQWIDWWEALGDTILDQPLSELPINVGIFAPWGCGKTSFMNFLEEYLKEKDDSIKTLWFYPWRYDRKQDLVSAFMFHLTHCVEADARPKTKLKKNARKASLKLVKFATWGAALTGERLTGGLFPGTEVNAKLWNQVLKTHSEFHDVTEHLMEETRDLVKQWVGHGRLVVFVDDLDRCLPEHAIQLLEALKLFLNEAPCIFVVGADRTVIEQAVRQHYLQLEKFTEREYLEKIFHLPFNLPPITEENIWKAYGAGLESLGLEDKKLRVPLRVGFGNNPRRYERFINLFPIVSRLGNRLGFGNDMEGRAILISIIVIRIRFHRLFEKLTANPISASLGFFSEWCYGRSEAKRIEFEGQQIGEFYEDFSNPEIKGFFRQLGAAWKWDNSASNFYKLFSKDAARVQQALYLSAR